MSTTKNARFEIWQTITLEAWWDGDNFFRKLNGVGSERSPDRFAHTEEAEEMISKLRGSEEPQTIDLFLLHLNQLGLRENSSIDQICAAAAPSGVELCPRELAPYLLMKNKIGQETFLVGMRPIFIRTHNTPCISVFYVNGLYRRLQHRCCCEGQTFCNIYTTWLFAKSHKQTDAN